MSAPTLIARYAPLPPRLRKGRADARALTLESVLSAPYPDLAGDIVDPAGLDWSRHAVDPGIDLEHARDPRIGTRPVAWARPTLSKAGPYHRPIPTRLNFGTDESPEWHTVPVGTEWFDPADRVSMQVFALCEQDALPGRSLEFSPVPGYAKALGKSPLEPRDAFHFRKAVVHRWTVCAQPVCEFAYQQRLSKSVGGHQLLRQGHVPPADAMLKVLRDKRVNVGGRWEALCPYLLKALAPAETPTRTTVRIERKAMDDDEMMPDTTTALEADTAGPEDMGPPAKPTVQAHYDVAQSVLDAIEAGKAALEASEHVKGKQFLMKQFAKLEALAEDIKGMGDKIDAELGSDAADTDVEADTDPEADEPEEFADADMETDDDGVLKAVRPVYYKALKGKRFTPAEIKKGQELDPNDPEVKQLLARAEKAGKWLKR